MKTKLLKKIRKEFRIVKEIRNYYEGYYVEYRTSIINVNLSKWNRPFMVRYGSDMEERRVNGFTRKEEALNLLMKRVRYLYGKKKKEKKEVVREEVVWWK